MITKKKCPRCKNTKERRFFHRNVRNADGLQSTCAACLAKQKVKDKEKQNKSETDPIITKFLSAKSFSDVFGGAP